MTNELLMYEINSIFEKFWVECGVKFGKQQTIKDIKLPNGCIYWRSWKIKDDTIFVPIECKIVGDINGAQTSLKIQPIKKNGKLGQVTTLYKIKIT